MAAESNVGARLLLIGKDGVLAGLREITTATANLNREIAAGGKASKTAAAGMTEQDAVMAAQTERMKLYQTQLGRVNAETDALARVGKVAFLGLAAAGVAWTAESIKWATNYQTALTQLRTQAGLTVTAMNAIGSAAMRNAAALGISPTAYVQAAYHPASTGFSTGESIAITSQGARLAAIGNAPVDDTVQSLTSTMKAYGFGTGQTQHTAALLNAIVGAGNMHWSDLNSALSSGIASTAHTFGVSLSSAGGALARLTDLGTPAAQAGNRLRMALALLGAPTQESDKLLTAAGMDTTQATASSSAMASALVAAGLTTTQLSGALRNNSGAGGIYNALELLHQHLRGLSPEAQSALLSRAFGGGRMGTSIMQLYGNLPALQAKSGQIDKGSTNKKYMEDWAATTKTLNFQLHQLGAELETLGTQYGTAVLPWVTKGIAGFTSFLKVLGQNKALALALGGTISAVLVPAIGVYLYRALLSSGGAIRSVISGYTRLILGQTAERASLERTTAMLTTETGATYKLVAADEKLATISREAGLPGGSGGAGGSLASKALKAATIAGVGYTVASIAQNGAPNALSNKETRKQMVQTVLGEMGKGAALGAGIGSFAGPEGTAIGAGLGAAAGGIYAERHQIGHAIDTGWHDIFGGGSSTTQTLPRGVIRNQVYVYIDGKQVTNAVVKHVAATKARK